jgi:hypothetical protein
MGEMLDREGVGGGKVQEGDRCWRGKVLEGARCWRKEGAALGRCCRGKMLEGKDAEPRFYSINLGITMHLIQVATLDVTPCHM